MSFLGIDLGTSGLRALLVDRSGRAIATAERNYETQHPHAGWSEQDPRKWTQALEAVVEELAATQSTFADLSGVAVSGHMHGAVLIDDQGTLIRPCILWNDTRSHAEAARLDACQSQSNKGPNTRGKWGPLRLVFCGALAGVLVI